MGPLVDTSAFGEAVPQNADKRKREEDKKAKKSKKEKREKGEKASAFLNPHKTASAVVRMRTSAHPC